MTVSNKLELKQLFHHSANYLYKVFTHPQYMKVWWTPQTIIESDPIIGGKWRIARPFEGEVFISQGKFLELIPDQKIVYTYQMPMFSNNEDIVSIIIQPISEEESEITLVQEGVDIEAELDALNVGEMSESEQGCRIVFDMIENRA